MKSIGLKSLVSNALLLFLLAGAAPTQALAVVDSAHLEQTWRKSGEQVDPAAMDRLLEVMEQDPETHQLLKDITAKLGVSTPEEIIKILELCKDDNTNWGTFYHSPTVVEHEVPDGEERPWDEDTQKMMSEAIETQLIHEDGNERAWILKDVSICIHPDLTLLDSFTTFVHELTHFKGYQLLEEETDILSYTSEADFVQKELFKSGGEYEAFSAGERAGIRMNRKFPRKTHFVIEKFFDKDGNVKDEAGLANYILDDMGYRQKFVSDFKHKVVWQYNWDVSRYNSTVKNLVNQRNNREIEQDNVDNLRAYLAKARNGRYPAYLIDDAEQKLRNAEKRLQRASDRVNVLEKRKGRLDAHMEGIKARFGSYFAPEPKDQEAEAQ